MKLAYTVFVVLFVIAILNSFIAIGGATPVENYWETIKREQSALKGTVPNPSQIGLQDQGGARELAFTYRQNGDELQAEPIFTQLWKLDVAKKSRVYDPDYLRDAANLAQLYEERAAFDTAFYYRKLILDYDRKCWPAYDTPIAHDNRIARDLTNYAVTLHLAGMTKTNVPERSRYYEAAEKTYREAHAIYLRNPALKAHLAFNLLDQALVLRDLGRSHESVQLTVQANSILKSLKSS